MFGVCILSSKTCPFFSRLQMAAYWLDQHKLCCQVGLYLALDVSKLISISMPSTLCALQ